MTQPTTDGLIEQMERKSVEALIAYLEASAPTDLEVQKARIAQGAFASAQRRWAAQNNRDALALMMQRDGRGRKLLSSTG